MKRYFNAHPDGRAVGSRTLTWRSWVAAGTVGALTLTVAAELSVSKADATAAAVNTARPAAITGTPYLSTTSSAWRAYASATDPAAKRDFYNIASTATSTWLNGGSGNKATVARIVADAAQKHQVPQFVLSALPGKDCKTVSAAKAAAYKTWVHDVVSAIGTHEAVVTIEPNAISFCGNNKSVRTIRTSLLQYVASQLRTRAPQVAAYLAVGSGDLSYSYLVSALKDSGIANLRGFALNVTSYELTTKEQAYGDQLVKQLQAAKLGTKHYIVDTSRNGIALPKKAGVRTSTCNNPDAALGTRPTTKTSGKYADAYMWIKPPGESDGVCHPGDPSGWFPTLARKLVANAHKHNTIVYRAVPQPAKPAPTPTPAKPTSAAPTSSKPSSAAPTSSKPSSAASTSTKPTPTAAATTVKPDQVTVGTSGSKPAAVLGVPYVQKSDAWYAYMDTKDPVLKRQLYQISSTSTSTWLGGSSKDAANVAKTVADAKSKNQIPQFVFYAMPGRDCGGLSAGGLASTDAYEAWVRGVVAAIGNYPAVVIVEPDAIDFCGNQPAVRSMRTTLLKYVASQLHTKAPQVAAYLHAGSGSAHPDSLAKALEESGIADLRGFALNVASIQSTAAEQTFGDSLVKALQADGFGTKHYVIDTSRNGIGSQPNPGGEFVSCNNPNVAIGIRPTSSTTDQYADMYLWVKMPGGSDGKCHPGDPTGFWPELASKLVTNSVAHSTIAYLPLPS